jgi:S-formylglutathione hydrolase
MSAFTVLKEHRSFGGTVRFMEHQSRETKTKMKLSCYLPAGEINGCLIWLSGLTCSEENFITKAGAQKVLAELGLMIVCPDTSPRGLNLTGEHDSWDFGEGAGFYVDAVTPGYADHYRMYSYVADELYGLLVGEFAVGGRVSIMGHSMGGHGALVIGLRNPKKFKSISAFAPIVNPLNCRWGQKAFSGYLGADSVELWKSYDACELIKTGKVHPQPILIDQGANDQFIDDQLLPQSIVDAARSTGQKIFLNKRSGYDHSYYFIASFVDEHIRFHSEKIIS